MANPLYQQFGQKPQNNQIAQVLERVKEFQRTYQGDAKAEVERMVSSGILPQNVFNELAQETNQIMALMKQ